MKVMIFGTFDNLHLGHKFVLDSASGKGNIFVVIARDSSVQKIKGNMPSQTENIRLKAIKDMYPEFEVILGDEHDYLAPVRAISPNLILLGYDQRFPPSVKEEDLNCNIERLEPFEEEKWKTSLLRKKS
ncbi:MAG: adenylyltransferase/cytidyltransferase family protein [Candidatus Peribacteraceae bacterium]|nr:adenylyltransferase/cytidyltransferase family protein [Candidatus Peribacteraceae bacterium]